MRAEHAGDGGGGGQGADGHDGVVAGGEHAAGGQDAAKEGPVARARRGAMGRGVGGWLVGNRAGARQSTGRRLLVRLRLGKVCKS